MLPETTTMSSLSVSPAPACLRYEMLVLETRIKLVLRMNVKHELVHVEVISSGLSSGELF